MVYEDDDLLIVDKPAGLVVHPRPATGSGTLVNALLARDDHYGGIAGVARPGIVHRLDRDTSGLLIVARNDAAQASLMAQLKARRVRKTYLALVQGSVGAAVGRIEAPIGRDPKDRKRMAVVNDGRRAVDGLPGPRAVLRLDAARARPRHRAHAPDPRPPRGARPPGRGRPGLRDRHVTPGAGRPRAAVPPRLAARARLAVRRRSSSAPRRRCRPPSRACSTGCGLARLGRAASQRGRVVSAPEALDGAPVPCS